MTAKSPARLAAEKRGRQGERIAAWWLRLKGWRILDRRVRTRAGEIDLIARRGNLVIFIEVKARSSAADLDMAIDERRLARVAAAAESVAHRYMKPGDDMQIDVILLAPGRAPRHLSNVWHGGA
ncbi:MAG: YraN family protein [Sphingobium sp.]|nr:YraN family protein [Sphingobium sp.]MCP5400186.1 YraN family protein [Sphingomonas sp.]